MNKVRFGLKKSALQAAKSAPDSLYADGEAHRKQRHTHNSSKKSSSKSAALFTPEISTNTSDDSVGARSSSSSSNSAKSSARNQYKNDFHDSGGLENQSVQELENYAVYKAEETTKAVDGCLKIAEEMRDDAAKTLVALHQQGEQITRSHYAAADIDQNLSRGEKLLGSLGGMFSTWKPKKTRAIKGPIVTADNTVRKKGNHLGQRQKLGLGPAPKEKSRTQIPHSEPANALQKVEIEKMKQDDGLSDLSNIVGELKNMAIDMGDELEWQKKATDHFHVEVDEINGRTEGAIRRGRDLLSK